MSQRTWISFPKIRRDQFAALTQQATQRGIVDEEIISRILQRRDERERFLLKSLVFQIAVYIALIGAPIENGTIQFFGVPLKAAREVLLFLLGIMNLLAVFNGMTIRVLTDFLDTWQTQKFPVQLRAIGAISYPSIFSAAYWAPPPSLPLKRGPIVKIIVFAMTACPLLAYAALFVAGLVAAAYVAIVAWHQPSLPPILSKSVVVFFVTSYLVNLFYAVVGAIPLPYRK